MQAQEFDLVGAIMDYEDGNLDLGGTLALFQNLIRTGMAWSLQGSYGRAAQNLIDNGYITRDGEIDWDLVNERIE